MFGLFVNSWVRKPFYTARAILEGNWVIRALVKSCSTYSISNDSDIFGVWDLNNLIDSASDWRQFCLSETKVFYEVYQRTGKLYLNDCWCPQLNSWFSDIVWMSSYPLINDRVLPSSNIDHPKVN